MTYDKDTIDIIPYPSTARAENLTGRVFNRLTVLGFAGRNRWYVAQWWCKCTCGNVSKTTAAQLRSGKAQSCGCLSVEILVSHRRTHGQCSNGKLTYVYRVWRGMIQRCKSPIPYYGAKGIKVCQRWRESVDNFIADMGEPPSEQHSIDRIDSNGDYCPDNCRWATPEEQSNNRSCVHSLNFQGQSLTISQWSRKLGLNVSTIHDRIRRGWSVTAALSTPARKLRRRALT